jgi:transposase
MNQWRSIKGMYPPSVGMCGRGSIVRKRGSRLDTQRDFIDSWLARRAQAANKLAYSQRALASALEQRFDLRISQSTLSRFFKKHQLEGFFHA